jgi:hypothetical protein
LAEFFFDVFLAHDKCGHTRCGIIFSHQIEHRFDLVFSANPGCLLKGLAGERAKAFGGKTDQDCFGHRTPTAHLGGDFMTQHWIFEPFEHGLISAFVRPGRESR